MEDFERKISLPEGFEASAEGSKMTVGFKGKQLVKDFHAQSLSFDVKGKEIVVSIANGKAKKRDLAVLNAVNSEINNMLAGLSKGFEYKLEVVYAHFPMNISVKEKVVEISNLCGSKMVRRAAIVGETKVEIKGKEIFVRGADKEAAGQTAANIEQATRLSGKDVRVFNDGIYIVSKPHVSIEEREKK
ncbi:MAG: 50S ribosomal protein L6 [Candidatus Diapherotrites archaeon]